MIIIVKLIAESGYAPGCYPCLLAFVTFCHYHLRLMVFVNVCILSFNQAMCTQNN